MNVVTSFSIDWNHTTFIFCLFIYHCFRSCVENNKLIYFSNSCNLFIVCHTTTKKCVQKRQRNGEKRRRKLVLNFQNRNILIIWIRMIQQFRRNKEIGFFVRKILWENIKNTILAESFISLDTYLLYPTRRSRLELNNFQFCFCNLLIELPFHYANFQSSNLFNWYLSLGDYFRSFQFHQRQIEATSFVL